MNNMTSVFNSINQFDSRYKHLGNFGNERSACSLFSLITAYEFINTNVVTSDQHSENLDQAIGNFVDAKLTGSITFDQLLQFQHTYKPNDVIGTSVQLIEQNILGYEHMFKDEASNFTAYAIIFLKNYNFLTVLVLKQNSNVSYYVRNCHEKVQYEFLSKANLTNHLNETYQFNKELNLDGYTDADFSNVEFLVIDVPFNIKLNKTKQMFPSIHSEQTTFASVPTSAQFAHEPEPDPEPEPQSFQIEGFYSDDSDEENMPDDISEEDDFMADEKAEMSKDDADMQMALALQQEFGDDNMANVPNTQSDMKDNIGDINAMDAMDAMGLANADGTDVSMDELVKQQMEMMKAFQK